MKKMAKIGMAAMGTMLVLAPGVSLAQDWRGTPVFGSVSLQEGFTPDPHEIQLSAGGPVDASRITGVSCAGMIGQNPDYQVRYSGGSNLYVRSNSDGDTSLVVRSQQGQWYCDDDTNGLNPEVVIPNAGRGTYSIWVGSVGSGNPSATLSISELSENYGSGGGSVDMAAAATFGEIILRSGFTPDPHNVQITAGGTISASNVANHCSGYIASNPDYEVTYRDAGSFPLNFKFRSSGDTTLVINAPDGSWYCDDDSGGNFNPLVKFPDAMEGVYDIWVGTISDDPVHGTLSISEVQ